MENNDALVLGMKALQRGFVTSAQLQNLLIEHARGLNQGNTAARSMEMILLSRGFVTPQQLSSLLEAPSAGLPAPTAQASPMKPPLIPASIEPKPTGTDRFGKYELRRLLGRGSMGLVFEAVDTTLNRVVALKRPFNRLPGQAPHRLEEQRFFTEAGLATLIPKHPNVVEVYEAGRIDGQCYLAMELIEGRTLSEWKRTATLQHEMTALLETARAVHHAHEYNVIHRDLKPANIMIRPNGRAVVTDFGLAKSTIAGQAASLTPVGFTIGTPGYMSPEQAQGRKHIDRTTDVYSLGVMLYETLTGRKPFEGRSAMDVLIRMMNEPVRRPSTIMRAGLNPVLLQNLETVCLKAMARDPWNRYPTAKAFADSLERLIPGRIERVGPLVGEDSVQVCAKSA